MIEDTIARTLVSAFFSNMWLFLLTVHVKHNTCIRKLAVTRFISTLRTSIEKVTRDSLFYPFLRLVHIKFINIVYSCFVIMYCCTLICYMYTIVLTKVTKNKDIYIYIYILSALFSDDVHI